MNVVHSVEKVISIFTFLLGLCIVSTMKKLQNELTTVAGHYHAKEWSSRDFRHGPAFHQGWRANKFDLVTTNKLNVHPEENSMMRILDKEVVLYMVIFCTHFLEMVHWPIYEERDRDSRLM